MGCGSGMGCGGWFRVWGVEKGKSLKRCFSVGGGRRPTARVKAKLRDRLLCCFTTSHHHHHHHHHVRLLWFVIIDVDGTSLCRMWFEYLLILMNKIVSHRLHCERCLWVPRRPKCCVQRGLLNFSARSYWFWLAAGHALRLRVSSKLDWRSVSALRRLSGRLLTSAEATSTRQSRSRSYSHERSKSIGQDRSHVL